MRCFADQDRVIIPTPSTMLRAGSGRNLYLPSIFNRFLAEFILRNEGLEMTHWTAFERFQSQGSTTTYCTPAGACEMLVPLGIYLSAASSIVSVCFALNPRCSIAPDGQAQAQLPQPLQSASFTCETTLPPFAMSSGAS